MLGQEKYTSKQEFLSDLERAIENYEGKREKKRQEKYKGLKDIGRKAIKVSLGFGLGLTILTGLTVISLHNRSVFLENYQSTQTKYQQNQEEQEKQGTGKEQKKSEIYSIQKEDVEIANTEGEQEKTEEQIKAEEIYLDATEEFNKENYFESRDLLNQVKDYFNLDTSELEKKVMNAIEDLSIKDKIKINEWIEGKLLSGLKFPVLPVLGTSFGIKSWNFFPGLSDKHYALKPKRLDTEARELEISVERYNGQPSWGINKPIELGTFKIEYNPIRNEGDTVYVETPFPTNTRIRDGEIDLFVNLYLKAIKEGAGNDSVLIEGELEARGYFENKGFEGKISGEFKKNDRKGYVLSPEGVGKIIYLKLLEINEIMQTINFGVSDYEKDLGTFSINYQKGKELSRNKFEIIHTPIKKDFQSEFYTLNIKSFRVDEIDFSSFSESAYIDYGEIGLTLNQEKIIRRFH